MRKSWVSYATPLLIAANSAFACWSLAGMETCAYAMLCVAAFWFDMKNQSFTTVILCFLCALIRPEGVIIFAIISFKKLILNNSRFSLKALLWSAGTLSLISLIFIGRYLYFDEWLPNTFYTKVGSSYQQVLRGVEYFQDYAQTHEGIAFILIPSFYLLLKGCNKEKVIGLSALSLWGITILVGGDGLPMFRFSIAALPFVVISQMAILVRLETYLEIRFGKKISLTAITFTVILLCVVNSSKPIGNKQFELYEFQKEVQIPLWTTAGLWLKENAETDASIAAVPIGAVGYYSKLKVHDMLGLTEKNIARKEIEVGSGWAGHEKHDGQYILSLRPTYILIGNIHLSPHPIDLTQKPFLSEFQTPFEVDLYSTDLIYENYVPKSVLVQPGLYFNFYQLAGD